MPRIKPSVFDSEKIQLGHEHAEYNIKYCVFYSDVDTTNMKHAYWLQHAKNVIENRSNRACFAGFRDMYNSHRITKKGKRPNRLRFFCNTLLHRKRSLHLSNNELRRWVELCTENKLMPSNMGEGFIKHHDYDISLDGISVNMLYVYLCSARYVQDEPFFVRSVIHMVDDCGMGFFTSIGVSTKFLTTNTGHHVINASKEYAISCGKSGLNDKEVEALNIFDLIGVAKLAKFVNGGDPGKTMCSLDKIDCSYQLHAALRRIALPKTLFTVSKADLKRKRLEKIIRTGQLDTPLIVRRKKDAKKEVANV